MARRLVAELVGTGMLAMAVVGSGIAAARLSPHDVGLQLLENAAATAAALVAIILAVGPVSGAHLNPAVSVVDGLLGGLRAREVVAYVSGQIAGGVLGAVAANLMFALPVVSWSTRARGGGGLALAEGVATFGLLLVVFGVARTGRANVAPFAVGAYIGGAYFFTSSTSFANPAVTIARTLSDTFAGISPSSVPVFVVSQALGGVAAFFLIRFLHPRAREENVHVVVPHETASTPDVPERLHAAEGEDLIMSEIPEVLFVCVHNAGRSQMAAGLLARHAEGTLRVRSAGSDPADRLNPAVVEAMREIGIDIAREYPKPLTDDAVRAADVVITMGCGDACPVYPGKRYLDWDLEDPAGKPIETVRRIRDQIDGRVRQLLSELTQQPS